MAANKPVRAEWNHFAYSYDKATGYRNVFLNGTSRNPDSYATPYAADTIYMSSNTGNLYLGNQITGTPNSFPGNIDEVRISNIARSADWVKATHDTIRPNSGFATLSAAEVNASALVIVVR